MNTKNYNLDKIIIFQSSLLGLTFVLDAFLNPYFLILFAVGTVFYLFDTIIKKSHPSTIHRSYANHLLLTTILITINHSQNPDSLIHIPYLATLISTNSHYVPILFHNLIFITTSLYIISLFFFINKHSNTQPQPDSPSQFPGYYSAFISLILVSLLLYNPFFLQL